MKGAGISAGDVDAWWAEVGSPAWFSFELVFESNNFRHLEQTPDMPMQVGESGTFTVNGDRLLLVVGEPGNIDTYTLGLNLTGNSLSLTWLASTEEGPIGGKELHRRFTIAFYCSAPFLREAA